MLAQVGDEISLFGWYLGFAVGAVVVVIVVVVVSWIIVSATRIRDQADQAVRALQSAHATTLPLWQVNDANQALERLHAKLGRARSTLE